jgi:hypothetical protein
LLQLRPWILNRVRRGFTQAEPDVQARLDDVFSSFAFGYNHVMAPRISQDLSSIPVRLRGFSVEGAAMGAALGDILTFSGGRRFESLAALYGAEYIHLIHVGAGWAFARLHRRPWLGVRSGEPLVRWLAWDGWGFHQALFHPERVFHRHWIEAAARRDARAIRDQGAGRALWFYAGADPDLIAAIIGQFPEYRMGDLWAGIGLAASYTGAQSMDAVERLARAAGGYRPQLGQGAAFAAKAHVLAGEVPPSSAEAIGVLTGAEVAVAAEWTDASLAAVRAREADDIAAYQQWRANIMEDVRRRNGGGAG